MRFDLFTTLNNFRLGLFVLLFYAIASCGGGSDSTVSSELYTIKVIHDPEITLIDAKIKIRLYGVNNSVADTSASVISETVLSINKIPSSFVLSWPENAYLLIKNPPVKSKENAIYYFSITIDENNDELLCNNDYGQDYKNTPFYTITSKPSGTSDFNVTLRTSTVCDTF